MKPIILVAILLLSLFLIPMTLAFQQSVQIPKIMLTKPSLDSGCVIVRSHNQALLNLEAAVEGKASSDSW